MKSILRGFLVLVVFITFFCTYFTRVSAEVFTYSSSSSGIKARVHTQSDISQVPSWLTYNFNDVWPLWSNPIFVDTHSWKKTQLPANGNFTSSEFKNDFYFLNTGTAAILNVQGSAQASESDVDPTYLEAFKSDLRDFHSNAWYKNGTRTFVRAKFNMGGVHSKSQIKKATLYLASDNVSKFWINGKIYGNKDGSLSHGCPGFESSSYLISKGLYSYDVKDLLEPGKNILAFNFVNVNPCGNSYHPMGLQFYLYVEYTNENIPPVCGTLTKSPNQSYYLPQTNVSLVANATDADGDNLHYTNWQVLSPLGSGEKGYFSTSTARRDVTYKTPKNATTETVTFTVSDGKAGGTVTCKNPITTKETFRCSETSQCVLDATGSFNSFKACSDSCQTKYTCNSNNQCVTSTNGEYSSIGACQTECKADVSCNKINFSKNGTTATVSANVNNFTSDITTYSWDSSYSSKSITIPHSNGECSSPGNCTMFQKNTSYTVPSVTYNLPPTGIVDTLTLKINNNPNIICTYDIGGKDIALDIEKDNYSTSVGGVVTAKLIVTPTTTFDKVYNIYLNCPGQVCRFKDIAVGNGLQRQIDYTKSANRKTQTFEFTITGVTPNNKSQITANGYAVVSNGDNYTRSDTAYVNVSSAKALSVEVKETTNYEVGSPLTYCDNFSDASLVNRESTTNIDIRSGSSTSFYQGGLPLPALVSTIPNGQYTFYVTGTEPSFGDSKEVYCTKVITDSSNYEAQRSASSFTLTSSDSTVKLIAVVGPKISTGWFKAFGGNGYALGDFSSEVPLGQKLFDLYKKIRDGVVATAVNFSGLDNTRAPNKYIKEYSNPQTQLAQFRKNIEDVYNSPKYVGANVITNLDSIKKDQNKSVFYIYEGDLTINNDFIIDSGAKTPVLYVKSNSDGVGGKVTIGEDVQRLDLYIIADKDVFIGSKQTSCSPKKQEISTSTVDYRVHTFRINNNGVWKAVSFRSTVPVVGDINQGGKKISGKPLFELTKPDDANYVEIKPYWVQSGDIAQDNEFIKYTTTLNSNDGEKSVICGDIDGSTNPTTWGGGTINGVYIPAYSNNINKEYACSETISGNVDHNLVKVVPTFPSEFLDAVCMLNGVPVDPKSDVCKGSTVANVVATWYKVTKPDDALCDNVLNLQVRGAIIANGNINIASNSPNTQQTDPSEEFYYSPDALFSNDHSGDGFKVVNIYLKSID